MNPRDWRDPAMIVALGIAGLAILVGLSYLLPPLVESVGAAVGLGVATATTGFATAGFTASWLPTVATASMGLAGASVTVLVLKRVTEKAAAQPFEYLLPLFVILSALVVDLTKDTLFANSAQKAVYTAATAGLLLGGGILLRQAKVVIRIMGIVLPFIPVVAVWLLAASRSQQRTTIENLREGGAVAGWGLVASGAIAVVVIVLAIWMPKKES